ncbi:MAG: MFS transporter [Bacteroidota bacterium]
MKLTASISKHNYYSLLWHAGFLAFARNFIDIDTVIPAMMIESGGTAIHIGILTAIMLGGSSFTQLIFAPFISNYSFKKKFLLLGINSRILALLAIGAMLYYSSYIHDDYRILLIFILISIFSLGGAFANISYTDILGKSVSKDSRKPFFSVRQVITGLILLGSVFVARWVLTADEYPMNYAHMFLIGFVVLALASLGFWSLKESVPSKLTVKNPGHFLNLVKSELKNNQRLGYFLGFINTMGISIGFLPFVILYAKENFNTHSSETANFLLFKIAGSVIMGFLLFALSSKFKYRNLLYLNAALAFILPLLMMFSNIPPLNLVFVLGGIIFAVYNITMNGVLLEVSGTTNRALYTGIAGAGNVLPALFPLLGGWLIMHFGYNMFFGLYMVIILSSLYFVFKLKCKR